jgi:sec-independent protein translocase protein TatA
MFGMGIPELIVVCVIALLVFGPKKLPDAGKAIGEAIRGFRSSMDGRETERVSAPAPAVSGCPDCGKPADRDAAYCPACGRALARKAA